MQVSATSQCDGQLTMGISFKLLKGELLCSQSISSVQYTGKWYGAFHDDSAKHATVCQSSCGKARHTLICCTQAEIVIAV